MVTEEELVLAQKIARSQSYKWKLDEEEILSHLYLWLCEQQKYVVAYREDPYGKQKLSLALTRAAIKQCKEEKMIQAGGEQDNYYTIPQLKKILPYIWDTPVFTNTTTQTQDIANELTTIIADVGQAYHALPKTDKQILETHYRDGKTYRETSAVYGITEEAARKRISRALTRLHTRLGGEAPVWK